MYFSVHVPASNIIFNLTSSTQPRGPTSHQIELIRSSKTDHSSKYLCTVKLIRQ